MPFEYCEYSGAACAKQPDAQEDPSSQASALQQKEHEQQLSNELEEKAVISDAKRGAGKKDGAKPVSRQLLVEGMESVGSKVAYRGYGISVSFRCSSMSLY